MIKAIVISDTHGDLSYVKEIIRKEKPIDAVFHLGDIAGQDDELKEMCGCAVYVVKGNCDFYSPNRLTEVVTLGENRIFMTHGHMYDAYWGVNKIVYAALENNCNIAMYGHTHVPDITPMGGVLVLNPGSTTQPRQLKRERTYIQMIISEEGKTDCRVKTL